MTLVTRSAPILSTPRSRRLPLAPALLALLLPAFLLPALAPPASAAVLVELFTAQGCSSCPPADRLLSAMGSDPDLSKQVVPLAFHVDYWDTAAWRDRFSDAAWTKRQTAYVRAAGGAQVYTPQAVIGGREQCVGSDIRCIHTGVEAATARPEGTVELSFPKQGGDAVEVAVAAQPPAGERKLEVMLAVYENGLSTEVAGGENAHKTLRDDFVVRRLQRAYALSGSGRREETVTLQLDPQWQRDKLGVAVFLQDPKTHRVFGATSALLPPG